MFDFLDMIGDYDSRKIDRYETESLIVSTAKVCESDQPYETAVAHPDYNDGALIIVDMYDSPDAAQSGHDRWVNIMTSEELPSELVDVSSSSISIMRDSDGGIDWRVYPRIKSNGT